jgi:tetratricopeptide (TPR) repeat protein
MKKSWVYGFLPIAVISVLFFGCGEQPGEKLYFEALSQWEEGNHIRARALLEKSISRRAGSIENADANNRLGLLLWEMGEVQLAVDAFNESLRIDQDNYAALCNLGVALSATTDLPAAERAFREAALKRSDDPRPLAYAGVVYAQNQNWTDAARNLQRALIRNPEDPQLQTALALTELHTQGARAALSRLQNIIQKNPAFAPALFNTATIHRYWLGDTQRAKLWFERYLQHASGIDALSETARIQLQELSPAAPAVRTQTPATTPRATTTRPVAQTPRTATRVQTARTPAVNNPTPKVAQSDRETAMLYFQRAVTDHRNGKVKEAIRGYSLAVSTDNTYDRAYYNLGLAYYSTKQMSLAGQAFTRAIQLKPNFVDAYYNLALVNYYHLGKTQEAFAQLTRALSYDPNYKPALELIQRMTNQ